MPTVLSNNGKQHTHAYHASARLKSCDSYSTYLLIRRKLTCRLVDDTAHEHIYYLTHTHTPLHSLHTRSTLMTLADKVRQAIKLLSTNLIPKVLRHYKDTVAVKTLSNHIHMMKDEQEKK